MEIKINIPANDYVQPTEVRQEVVQSICEEIVKNMGYEVFKERGFDIKLKPTSGFYQLYINFYKDGKCAGFKNSGDSTYSDPIRIRTEEMKTAFEVLQNAGYFIYGSKNVTTNVVTYVFSKKPMRGNIPAEKIDFTEFID